MAPGVFLYYPSRHHFLMKTLPRVASGRALHVLAYNPLSGA